MFPTEQSLANIDEVIGGVKSKIRTLDTDIRLTIRGHSDTEIDEHKALEDAQNSILLLFQQMREIKDKADKSEEMVHRYSLHQFFLIGISLGQRNHSRYQTVGYCKEESNNIYHHTQSSSNAHRRH